MKKIEIHLSLISNYRQLPGCQLLGFSSCTSSQNFKFMSDINLTQFDKLAATFDQCRIKFERNLNFI